MGERHDADPVDGSADAERAVAALAGEIAPRVRRLLGAVGVDPDAVDWRIDCEPPLVHVRLKGPAIAPALRSAIAVRVLDAVRASGRTWGHVDVTYEPEA